jgi:transcriptional regulator with XRE-family HTH domain
MAKKTAPLLPSTDALLRQFGDRLRLARQRRRLAAKQVAERAGMSPMTLRSLERGGSGVTMGAYLAVMQVLGIESDLGLLGNADPQGRELQDARMPAASRRVAQVGPKTLESTSQSSRSAPVVDTFAQLHRAMESSPLEQLRKEMENSPQEQLRADLDRLESPSRDIKRLFKSTENGQSWREQSGFTDSETLAGLIRPLEPLSKNRR